MKNFTPEKNLSPPGQIPDDDVALQRAENEGLPFLSDRDEASHLFARVSMRLRNGLAPAARGNLLTLEELLAAVNTATQGDRQLRQRYATLVALLVSDIRNAKQFSIDSWLRAKPLRDWRERYNGLEVLR